MTECRNYGSSEDQAVWLAEEVPGFAVVGVGVAAGVAVIYQDVVPTGEARLMGGA